MAQINIAGTLHNTEEIQGDALNSHVVAHADEILDATKEKKQSEVNADVDTALADRYTKEETYSKEQLDSMITTPDVNYVSVVATTATTAVTDILPATGAANTIYRVGNWNGTQYDPTMYALYAWNGSAYVCLAVRSFVGEVYDVSANHPDGQGNPTPYADLAAALGTDGVNIPADIRRGGMSIKFIQGTVQSSDNKYVQYRLMSKTFSTTESDWQGIDKEIVAGSHNLAESGAVAASVLPITADIGYYVCNTEGYVQKKAIVSSQIPGLASAVLNGGNIRVKFTYANRATSDATFQFGLSGEKPLFYNGARATSLNTWEDGDVVELYYDSTYDNNNGCWCSVSAAGEVDKLVGKALYLRYTIYAIVGSTNSQIVTVNFKKGKLYAFTITETPAGCVDYLRILTNDGLNDICKVYPNKTAYFIADKDYSTVYFSLPSAAVSANGNVIAKVYENAFITSDYLYDILQTEKQLGNIYSDTQTSASQWMFERILNGRKGFLRVKGQGQDASYIYSGETRLFTVGATYTFVDLTNINQTRLYSEYEVGTEVYLDFIDYSVLSDYLFTSVNEVNNAISIKNYGGYSAMIPLTVKKDGSGDFATIQEAINSINDASIMKQYDIQVYDDFEITNLTDLWTLTYPSTHAGAEPSGHCALVITKDFVNVRGMGRKRKLSITSPLNLPADSFQYIQVIIPRGNCTIKNFEVTLSGGRYAIHQEMIGSPHLNKNATTILEDLVVVHNGNSEYTHGSAWTATEAQANGISTGCHWIYKNCKWIAKKNATGIYMHTNSNFADRPTIEFHNCSIIGYQPVSLARSLDQGFIYDIGSRMGADVKFYGNNFTGFHAFYFSAPRGSEQTRLNDHILDGEITFSGYGNGKMIVNSRENPSLSFKAVANNVEIEVVGGTAYDVLWGSTYKKFGGAATSSTGLYSTRGICVGTRKIYEQSGESYGSTSVFTLAYRLGNCANSPKNLIVNVNGTDYTIVFDKNYMTADGSDYAYNTTPRFTNDEIIADINAQFPSVLTANVGGWIELSAPEDCCRECVVHQNYNIEVGTVVYTIGQHIGSANKVVPSPAVGKLLLGIICQSTNKNEVCKVALADKNYFPMSLLYPNGAAIDTLFKVQSGKLVITTNPDEAVFYAIDEDTIAKYQVIEIL